MEWVSYSLLPHHFLFFFFITNSPFSILCFLLLLSPPFLTLHFSPHPLFISARLRTYFEMIRAEKINVRPELKILRETPSTASIDGDNGLGLVVGPKANEIAMKKAAEVGTGWVSICNTNHYGIAGYYVLEALKRDMIGISMTNTTRLVVPPNSAEPMLGTNPIAIAFPGKESPPIVIDMATSAVAWGKVEIANRKGVSIPVGWAVNSRGETTTNSKEVVEGGYLLPLGVDMERGVYKGYCMSIMVDVLCCLLSGANWGPFAPPFTLSIKPSERGSVGKGIGKRKSFLL
jgi:L-2-hydroxycarboxylate dehydrogenase (NAD+)